jgi:hypothetical protein
MMGVRIARMIGLSHGDASNLSIEELATLAGLIGSELAKRFSDTRDSEVNTDVPERAQSTTPMRFDLRTFAEEVNEHLEEQKGETKQCPKCGKMLKQRMGMNGPFIGCSGYPNCRHTEPVGGKKGRKNATQA